MGMWALFGKSFERNLITKLGFLVRKGKRQIWGAMEQSEKEVIEWIKGNKEIK